VNEPNASAMRLSGLTGDGCFEGEIGGAAFHTGICHKIMQTSVRT
jgi:hypothetical protein